MVAEEIILAPVVTEKSSDGIREGKYTFKVNKKELVELDKDLLELHNGLKVVLL